MLFSSIPFLLFFFPVVFAVYYALAFSRILQNVWLLAASLVFYAWGEPVYVFLMIGSILFNSGAGFLVEKIDGKWKKIILAAAVTGNLLVLFLFKYAGFVLSFFGSYGEEAAARLDLSLPIGISFYTFQALSYVIDVYRGKVKAENPFYVGLYISFFPQLIAGPIVQYRTIADQLRNRKSSIDKISVGICRFVTGLGKKVLLANSFGVIADYVFAWSEIGTDKLEVPASLAWLGSIAYTLQIYFDFSAYSDMAIGLGLCFGFRFLENFNYPYIATSVTDFWKRWHISLTDWFREYVYISLGGNRTANKDTMVRNMFIVWLLTGIWHGANLTFVLWGLIYFGLLLAERIGEFDVKVSNVTLRRIYTLLAVNFLWVLFRAENLYQAGRMYMNMFAINNNGILSDTAWVLLRENIFYLIAGIIFCTPVARNINERFYKNPESRLHQAYTLVYPVMMAGLAVICISYLVTGSYNPFIYFNF
ncbi:MAG: MBOAT family protein [Eubacterium sp.]|nr:MBOAT family protein [Eubacterium sp.]